MLDKNQLLFERQTQGGNANMFQHGRGFCFSCLHSLFGRWTPIIYGSSRLGRIDRVHMVWCKIFDANCITSEACSEPSQSVRFQVFFPPLTYDLCMSVARKAPEPRKRDIHAVLNVASSVERDVSCTPPAKVSEVSQSVSSHPPKRNEGDSTVTVSQTSEDPHTGGRERAPATATAIPGRRKPKMGT